jgi:hypothetical protein
LEDVGIYNARISSAETLELNPGKTDYEEFISALLPTEDKTMVLRMSYPCMSIKIDFIYEGLTPKQLQCWTFCPDAAKKTDKTLLSENHLNLVIKGPLLKGLV